MSVREWLDSVKAGYGEKFTACFESIGCEDKDDLTDIGVGEMGELESNLSKAGGKTIHLKKIKAAVAC